jgi:hypothetical protein
VQGVVVRQVDEEALHGAEVQHVQLAGEQRAACAMA